jgi:hypothetical protein
MYRNVWKKCQGSVCALDFYTSKGIRYESVSGFKYGKYLATDEMVYKINKASEVQISFFEDDGITISTSIKITDKDFRLRMVKGIKENIPGFALFDIDFPQFDNIPSLKFNSTRKVDVAMPVAVIGYQMEHANLAIKKGIVSSFCKQNGSRYIQFDNGIDRGNSGCPLIDVETCEVIGIVGHRLANLMDGYKRMMDVINNNLNMLKDVEGKLMLHDIDPIQVLVVNQNQIKHLAQDFFRTASFMYGFALDVNQILELLDVSELEKYKTEKIPVTVLS